MVADLEDFGEEAARDFGGGFADFAVELFRFFDDEDFEVGEAAFEQDGGGGAGEGTADDDDVVGIVAVRSADAVGDGTGLIDVAHFVAHLHGLS